jgi:PAS domain S-box-containing protein
MNLYQRGLLIIALPWLFQLGLSIALIILLFQTQEQVDRYARSEAVVRQSNALLGLLANSVLSFYEIQGDLVELAKATADKHPLDQYNKQLAVVTKLMDEQGPEGVRSKQIAVRTSSYVVEFCQRYLALLQQGRVQEAAHHLTDEAGVLLKTVSDDLNLIGTGEKEKQNIDEQNAKRSRDKIKIVLAIAALLGVGMSVGVALFCLLYIRLRIDAIDTNVKLFALRQPLNPTLSGFDELAQLDRVVHEVDRAVREASEREQTLIDSAADLICSVDRNGRFQRLNAFASRLLGRQPESLVGSSILDLVAQEDCVAADIDLNAACAAEGVRSFDLRLVHEDKHYMETAWSTFWSQPDGSLFCVVRDVTEQKNIERLKNDFLAMIKHDLRTPLMSLSLDISLLGKTGALPESELPALSTCALTVDHLIALVNDLLDYEKLLAGKMEYSFAPVTVDTLLADCYEAVRGQETGAHQPDVLPQMDIAERCDATVNGDRQALVQMLTNVIRYVRGDNAGGTSALVSASIGPSTTIAESFDAQTAPEATADSLNKESALPNSLSGLVDADSGTAPSDESPNGEAVSPSEISAGGNMITFTVLDRSSGTTAVSFEPFVDASNAAGNQTGLELAISRQIAQAHGGQVKIVNAGPGKRAFQILLPISSTGAMPGIARQIELA